MAIVPLVSGHRLAMVFTLIPQEYLYFSVIIPSISLGILMTEGEWTFIPWYSLIFDELYPIIPLGFPII